VVFGLLVELGDEIGPSGGKVFHPRRLFGAALRSTGYVDQDDREAFATERAGQGSSVLNYLADWVYGGESDYAFLQVNDDESSFGVKFRHRHIVFLLDMRVSSYLFTDLEYEGTLNNVKCEKDSAAGAGRAAVGATA
jgi:hypothetical protein